MCLWFLVLRPLQGYFHYFTGKSKYCSTNNSKEAFRVQKRNEKIMISFFFFRCCFGFTATSGLFHYIKGEKITVQQINKEAF